MLCPHTDTPLPKSLWCKEVKQVEELFKVVLERCSRKQQFVLKGVVIQHPEKLCNTGKVTEYALVFICCTFCSKAVIDKTVDLNTG